MHSLSLKTRVYSNYELPVYSFGSMFAYMSLPPPSAAARYACHVYDVMYIK